MGGMAFNTTTATGPNRFLPLMGVGLIPFLILILLGG